MTRTRNENNMDNANRTKKFEDTINYLSPKLKTVLNNIPQNIKPFVQEIRLKSGKIPHVIYKNNTYFVSTDKNNTINLVSPQDINQCLNIMCGYSIYSFQEQLKEGFITINGGNRVGICGTAVIKNGNIENIKNITSLNIRIAQEFKGCSKEIFENIKYQIGGTLISGPPGCGKTTILRDLARIISTDSKIPKKVTIVDERMEIASCFEGKAQMDVGLSDILSGFPKGEGILRAVRCLSPEVVICDEIGSEKDTDAIIQSLNSGICVIASVHAKSKDELIRKPQIKKLLNSGAFEKIILLNDFPCNGVIKNIYKVCDINAKDNRSDYFNFIGDSERSYSI